MAGRSGGRAWARESRQSALQPRCADLVGTAWRANSYKRAIARSGDHVASLIDEFGDEKTTFLIVGDHGHVAPGGMGGSSPEVRQVPLFAYRKGSNMGGQHKEARRVAGAQHAHGVRDRRPGIVHSLTPALVVRHPLDDRGVAGARVDLALHLRKPLVEDRISKARAIVL